MAKHHELTAWESAHSVGFRVTADPALTVTNDVQPNAVWIEVDGSDVFVALHVRDADNLGWTTVVDALGAPPTGTASGDLAGSYPAPTIKPDVALSGNPTTTTQAAGNNTTRIATTAFVQTEIAAVINAAPGALDTLDELAAALGDDANFAATTATALALKAPLASPTLTGTPAAPTAAPGTNTTQLATTAFVAAAAAAAPGAVASVFGRTGAVVKVAGDYAVADVTGAAPLASPTFTGTPAAPTATAGTNTTQLATTAFVTTAVATGAALTIDAQTGTTYTLVLTDAQELVTLSNASAITLTVPPNSSVAFPTGTRIHLSQIGAGLVTFAAGVGVTINSRGGVLNMGGQYAMAALVKIGTNTWLLSGDLA